MRLVVAAVVLGAAVAIAVGMNGYRASRTEVTCCTSSDKMFTPIGAVRSGGGQKMTFLRTWKPRWVLPASIFVAIVGAGAAASIGIRHRTT